MAKHGVGDPFIQISAHGKPAIVYVSQDEYAGKNPVTLKTGRKWSDLGVTRTIASKTVTCRNKSNHGFTIGKG